LAEEEVQVVKTVVGEKLLVKVDSVLLTVADLAVAVADLVPAMAVVGVVLVPFVSSGVQVVHSLLPMPAQGQRL
jgi:hypothetical protein